MERELIPKLRFLGFSENWKTYKLGSFSDIKAGYTFKQKYQGNKNGDWLYIKVADIGNKSVIKYLRTAINSVSNEVMEEIKAKPFRAGCTVFPRVGAALLNNNKKLLYEDSLIDDNVLAVKIVNSKICEDEYFYYWFLTRHLSEFCNNGQVPVISATRVKSYSIEAPCLKEQQKIASFLTAVDEKIAQFTKKKALLEQYKKGLMQQLFSQEIRFKDGDGKVYPKWKNKKLKEFIKHKSARNKSLNVKLVLSVSNSKGFIAQSEQFDNYRVASKDVSNYKIVEKNDIAYNPSRINVGSIAVLKNFEKGIVSPMYVVFGVFNAMDLVFFEYLIQTHRFNYLVKKGCSGSVRDSLNYEDLEEFILDIPCIDEQRQIANFFSALDDKIAQVDVQIEKTVAFKKGLLQKMFV